MLNYTHSTRYELPIAPSPNLQSEESILLYPSLCFFEGTSISIGRGTEKPFEVYGAPELTAGDYFFTPEPIKGVSENPPHKGEKCRGRELFTFANEKLQRVDNDFTLSYLIDAYEHYPDKDKFFTNGSFFDKLAGNSTLREMIQAGKSEEEITAIWEEDLEKFVCKRKKYLLYAE